MKSKDQIFHLHNLTKFPMLTDKCWTKKQSSIAKPQHHSFFSRIRYFIISGTELQCLDRDEDHIKNLASPEQSRCKISSLFIPIVNLHINLGYVSGIKL
jgi:hypothetical protein